MEMMEIQIEIGIGRGRGNDDENEHDSARENEYDRGGNLKNEVRTYVDV